MISLWGFILRPYKNDGFGSLWGGMVRLGDVAYMPYTS